jgi:hypothetical protein
MGRQRRWARRLIRHSLGGLGVLGAVWLLVPAPATGSWLAPTASAASTVQAAITRTAASFGQQIRADYKHAYERERRNYSLPSSQLLVVDHKATDVADHKPGQYELSASFTKVTHTVTQVEIREQIDLTDTTALADFAIARTDGDKYWTVSFVAEQPHSRFLATYHYATGGPLAHLPDTFPLTLHDFRLLAGMAQTELTDAKHATPFNYPSLPFPPPGCADQAAACPQLLDDLAPEVLSGFRTGQSVRLIGGSIR